MSTELERSRERLAAAAWRIVSTRTTDVTEPVLEANEALEEIFGHLGAFEPVHLPPGVTVSFEQVTRNDVTAVVSEHGVEQGRVIVHRPHEGPGVLGAARFHATEARYQRWVADCMRAAGKSESLIREAEQKAEEAETALRDLVISNPGGFNRHALAAQGVRAWLAGPRGDVTELNEALATEPLPFSPADVSRAHGVITHA